MLCVIITQRELLICEVNPKPLKDCKLNTANLNPHHSSALQNLPFPQGC